MSKQFKAGDLVRCIDASARGIRLYAITKGRTYEVLGEAGSTCIWIRDNRGNEIGPLSDRFELVADASNFQIFKGSVLACIAPMYTAEEAVKWIETYGDLGAAYTVKEIRVVGKYQVQVTRTISEAA